MPRDRSPRPQDRLPTNFGHLVRVARRKRNWTQAQLARHVGVTRATISRLETGHGQETPSAQLVRALLRDETLGLTLPVIDVEFADPCDPDRGYRAAAARRTVGLTLASVARAAGVSPASLSLFERSLAVPIGLVGAVDQDDGVSVINDGYAQALGFAAAADMSDYLSSDDPLLWLRRIAKDKERRLPPLALMPTRRLRPPEDNRPLID